MNRSSSNQRVSLAMVDAMLADPAGQPRAATPSTLHARTVEAVRRDAAAGARDTAAGSNLRLRLVGLLYGAVGVGVFTAAWLFVFQILSVATPPASPTQPIVRQATFGAVANLDERLLDESRSAAARIATAVSASYSREIEAMRADARRAAEKAASYKRWIAPTRGADGAPLTPEP